MKEELRAAVSSRKHRQLCDRCGTEEWGTTRRKDV